MNDNLFHSVADDSLKEKVAQSKSLPLIRELNHTYGLKVFAQSNANRYGDDPNDNFALCDAEQGFPIARVFTYDDGYCYYSPFQQKQRGVDDFDRHTFRSKKLSMLMTSLRKAESGQGIITKVDRLTNHITHEVNQSIVPLYNSFPTESKSSLNGEDAHRLLLAMKSGKSLDSFEQGNRDLYLKRLDEYEKADILLENREQGMYEMMHDCYIVGADKFSQYLVADYTCEKVDKRMVLRQITPFKRVKDFQEYPTILSTLTMLKVHLDNKFRPWADGSLVPSGDEYIPELSVSYGYRSSSDFAMEWVCISK
jgi:hypothetical protein